MKDEYVKYGTAKLLKEKGFDWECYGTYNIIEEVLMNEHSVTVISHTNKNSTLGDAWISAPTQQMACRWLREEKMIFISPFPTFKDCLPYSWRVDIKNCFGEELGGKYEYITYEDAVEAALKYVLKNLI